MRYLLDTNVVIALLNDATSTISRTAREHRPSDVYISAVLAHELFYGAYKSRRTEQNVTLIENLRLEVLDFDSDDARKSGQVRAALASMGTPIGPYDVLIAGQALARDMILVTHNTAEFSRVSGLRVEDWAT